jgi:4-amino-4-deoxy-L-arabinose transferase-like glycosyltransferase
MISPNNIEGVALDSGQPEVIDPAPRKVTPPPGTLLFDRSPPWLLAASRPRLAVPILALIGSVMFLLNLGGYPLYTKGEPREAVTVFDIVHGGFSSWILPMRAGVEIPSKPLMMHWLGAFVSLAHGEVSEWTVRLPSAILAVCGILACYLYARRLFDEVTGLTAAIVLGTAFQYLQAGGGARVDMTLTFFLEIAFFEFALLAAGLVARTTMLYLAIAAAVLSKGPIGVLLPALVAAIWIVIERRFELIRRLQLLRGAAIVAVIGGGWYLLAVLVGGSAFFRKQILVENIFTFLYNRHLSGGHVHPLYYVELALLLGFMPWTPLLLAEAWAVGVARLLSSPRDPGLRSVRIRYLIVWFLVVLGFYNLAHSKRGVYLLALYPAMATLLGVFIRDSIRQWDTARPQRYWWLSLIYGTMLLLGGAAALLGLAILWADPLMFGRILSPLGITTPSFIAALEAAVAAHSFFAIVLPGLVAAHGSYLLRSRHSAQKLIATTASAVCVFTIIVNLYISPAIANALTLRGFTSEVFRMVGPAEVAYLGVLNYDVAFYSRRNLPIASIFDRPLPEYLITGADYMGSLPESIRQNYAVVLRSNPTELDSSVRLVLLRRRPSSPSAAAGANHFMTAIACGAPRLL